MKKCMPDGTLIYPDLAWMNRSAMMRPSNPALSSHPSRLLWPTVPDYSPLNASLGLDFLPAWSSLVQTVQCMPVITAALLCGVMPLLTLVRAEKFTAPINQSFARYKINTAKRMAAFLGQIAVESCQLRHLEEGLYYSSASHLQATFKSKFKTVNPADYAKHPEKLANYVYADRLGNGNVASGEGWKYRGRGLIQITGKNNYEKFREDTGIDVIAKPELLLEPRYAVLSATWFWDRVKLNDLADSDHYTALTKRVNAGSLAFREREAFRRRALLLLSRTSLVR